MMVFSTSSVFAGTVALLGVQCRRSGCLHSHTIKAAMSHVATAVFCSPFSRQHFSDMYTQTVLGQQFMLSLVMLPQFYFLIAGVTSPFPRDSLSNLRWCLWWLEDQGGILPKDRNCFIFRDYLKADAVCASALQTSGLNPDTVKQHDINTVQVNTQCSKRMLLFFFFEAALHCVPNTFK